jgi:hypothetical protein
MDVTHQIRPAITLRFYRKTARRNTASQSVSFGAWSCENAITARQPNRVMAADVRPIDQLLDHEVLKSKDFGTNHVLVSFGEPLARRE